jgi:hypothetical protein
MECTIFSKDYMGLDMHLDHAFDRIIDCKNKCRLFQGDFTMLWHNQELIDDVMVDLYKSVLTA